MRILLTNDDGYRADGLEALKKIAYALTDDVWVAAPEEEQSGASRRITLTEPIHVRQLDEKSFAVRGTPTDCVLLAISDLMAVKPDLVLSGVNRGSNLGEDVTFSGTVAGALQAMELGIPAIALSQCVNIHKKGNWSFDYSGPGAFGAGIVERLLELGWPQDVVMNVNFPDLDPDDVKGVEVVRQGFRDTVASIPERRTDLRGRDYFWMGFRPALTNTVPGTDLHAIVEGKIAVTPLHIDLTHHESLGRLKGLLGGPPPKFKGRA